MTGIHSIRFEKALKNTSPRSWVSGLAIAGICAGLVAGATVAPAQAATRTEKTFSGWTVACVENDEQVKRCSLRQSRVRPQDRRVVFVWSITADDNNDLVQIITVPAGVSVKEGVRLFIGDGDPLTLGYDICGPRICLARATLSPELVATMKGSSKASASFVLASKQLMQLDLDVEGFAEAYDYLVQQLDS